ncbi:MAG: 2-hydroxy-acid oxidase, partial [Hyphomicrobiales bacterium]|nr:2-hydroxy-acid oxidase [Hyphomicrobiales bacterium]
LALLDAKNQQFSFEPTNTSRLLGTPDVGTIGGMISAGLAGPRRIQAGGARDHLLGVHAVSGFGESFKAGGRVVKNVTGYDVCKLIAGAWGTLAVMTEVTLKVMPRAEAERTIVLRGLDDVEANRAMTTALGSPYDISGAAHLPGSALRTPQGPPGEIAAPDQSATLIRLEGITASAASRAGSLATLLQAYGTAEIIDDSQSSALWADIRDVVPFAASGPRAMWPVWRIVCPPASGGKLGQEIAKRSQGEVVYDWGGGLIWAALPPSVDAQAPQLRKLVDAAGGHATLIRGSEDVRRAIDVFHPQAAGVAALGDRVRKGFDPKTILNRGRMSRALVT